MSLKNLDSFLVCLCDVSWFITTVFHLSQTPIVYTQIDQFGWDKWQIIEYILGLIDTWLR